MRKRCRRRQITAVAAEIDLTIGYQAATWSTAKVTAWSREIEAQRRAAA